MHRDSQAPLPHVTIDVRDRAEVTAWAYALHVTEKQLMDAVAEVGRDACDVIPYLLRDRPCAPAHTDSAEHVDGMSQNGASL